MTLNRTVLLVLLVGLLAAWSDQLCDYGDFYIPTKCTQPKEEGVCKAASTRFYHDMTDKQCKEFVYGGCGGNENNFPTLKDCLRECEERIPNYPCNDIMFDRMPGFLKGKVTQRK